MTADQPDWVLDLVAAVEHHEAIHGKPEEWGCLAGPLDQVPAEVRAMARGWDQAKRAAHRPAGDPS